MISVGDVLAVHTTGWAARLINVGAALRGLPAMDNHVVVVSHQTDGVWWGLEGKPGGVGWTTLDRYLASPYTVNNAGQPKSGMQRGNIAVLAESMLCAPYDWAAIAADGLRAIGAPDLFASDWQGQGPPGHVVCSSFAAWLYAHVGLPCPTGGRTVTPADWTAFALAGNYNVREVW